jgi:hypothetical protein
MEKTVGIAQRILLARNTRNLRPRFNRQLVSRSKQPPSFPLVEPDEATDRVTLISTESDAGGIAKSYVGRGRAGIDGGTLSHRYGVA